MLSDASEEQVDDGAVRVGQNTVISEVMVSLLMAGRDLVVELKSLDGRPSPAL